MLGKVGKDEAGKSMIRNLSEVAVDTSKIELSDASTGTAWICVNEEGDNSIVVIPGANNQVDIAILRKIYPRYKNRRCLFYNWKFR